MSTKTKKKSDVSVTIQEWINKFNQAKSWQNIEVPAPKPVLRRDENEEFVRSPANMLQQRIDAIGSPEELQTSEDMLQQARTDLQKLKDQVGKITDGDELRTIELDIINQNKAIQELEADIKLFKRLTSHLKKVKEHEKDLPQEVEFVVDEIKRLQVEAQNKNFDVNKLGEKKLKKFRELHENVSGRVENARQEVMTMEVATDSGKRKENYAVINSVQYKSLFGMLEVAILKLQVDDLDGAFEWVNKANEQLIAYRNVRTGADVVEQRKSFDPKVDEQLIKAQLMIDSLRQAGYKKAAEVRQQTYDGLYDELSTTSKSLAGTFLKTATRLAEDATKDMELSHKIDELALAARRDAKVMTTNGHTARPGNVLKRLEKFEPGTDLNDGLKRMQEIRDYAATRLVACNKQDLEREHIDPEQLKGKLAGLESRFDKFFKHDGEGKVKTQKDSKTGLEKGVKKNSDLPRETINEIDLKIKAAQQLLASDSVDALKLADAQLKALEQFLANIEQSPQLYAGYKKLLTKIGVEITDLGKNYGKYEASKRGDLQIELDGILKGYTTKPKEKVNEEIDALKHNVSVYSELVSTLRGDKHALEKRHASAVKLLAKIGERLKTTFKDETPKFDGYHGDFDRQLDEIHSKIEFRSAESLAEAETLLLDVEAKLLNRNQWLKKLGNKEQVLGNDHLELKAFVEDAKKGQTKHNDNMKDQKSYEEAVKELQSKLGDLKDKVKKLKGDLSNHGALESELKTIRKEADAKKTYTSALEQVGELAKRAEFQLNEATNASEVLNKDLTETVKMVVERVEAFSKSIARYYDSVVKPAGKDVELDTSGNDQEINQLDQPPFIAAKIQSYFKSIADALPKAALSELEKAANTVADRQLPREQRLVARNTALSSVRALMGVFEGKPLQHLRLSPFDDRHTAPAFGAVRQALPRLELKLLTEVEEKKKEKKK